MISALWSVEGAPTVAGGEIRAMYVCITFKSTAVSRACQRSGVPPISPKEENERNRSKQSLFAYCILFSGFSLDFYMH